MYKAVIEPRINLYKRGISTGIAVDNSVSNPKSNSKSNSKSNLESNYWIVVSNFVDNFLLGLLRKMRCFFRDSELIFSDEDVETDTVIDGWDKYGKPYLNAPCF